MKETVALGKIVQTIFCQFSHEPGDSYTSLIKDDTQFILSIAKGRSKP